MSPHGEKLIAALRGVVPEVGECVVPAGEGSKSVSGLERVLSRFAEFGLGRDGVVFAVGGGVAGDLAGFAAAVYMRGTRVVQVPTTLLAMVDSAIGGKTGINFAGIKNLVGAFHQPSAVLCDLESLGTLPAAESRAGLAEVVKYGMLGDAAFFGWLEENAEAVGAFDSDALRQIIIRSARAKAAIAASDERESDLRALLNLGHTFAHAIESATAGRRKSNGDEGGWEWRHGEAVSAGLVLAAELSFRVLDFPESDISRVRGLLSRLGLPVRPPEGLRDEMRSAMRLDKKNRAGRERFVLMRKLGEAAAGQSATESQLSETLDAAARA